MMSENAQDCSANEYVEHLWKIEPGRDNIKALRYALVQHLIAVAVVRTMRKPQPSNDDLLPAHNLCMRLRRVSLDNADLKQILRILSESKAPAELSWSVTPRLIEQAYSGGNFTAKDFLRRLHLAMETALATQQI